MTFEYDVLLFGSNRTRPQMSAELTERGRSGWRVVCGNRTDDGSWSFVLERIHSAAENAEPLSST